MFLGLPDPDPALNPSIVKKISKKTLISTVLSLLYDFLSLQNEETSKIKFFSYHLEGH